MKRLVFALSLLSAPADAVAGLCSSTVVGIPCTPDPGPATTAAKKAIMEAIEDAQDLEPAVRILKAEYIAIRSSSRLLPMPRTATSRG